MGISTTTEASNLRVIQHYARGSYVDAGGLWLTGVLPPRQRQDGDDDDISRPLIIRVFYLFHKKFIRLIITCTVLLYIIKYFTMKLQYYYIVIIHKH